MAFLLEKYMALPKVTPVYQGTRRSSLQRGAAKPHYKGVTNPSAARSLQRSTARRKSMGGAGG